ncbi:MAG: hypothetical protein WBY98_17685, partial [Candidatus Sulfotelmatobacter sp.]
VEGVGRALWFSRDAHETLERLCLMKGHLLKVTKVTKRGWTMDEARENKKWARLGSRARWFLCG